MAVKGRNHKDNLDNRDNFQKLCKLSNLSELNRNEKIFKKNKKIMNNLLELYKSNSQPEVKKELISALYNLAESYISNFAPLSYFECNNSVSNYSFGLIHLAENEVEYIAPGRVIADIFYPGLFKGQNNIVQPIDYILSKDNLPKKEEFENVSELGDEIVYLKGIGLENAKENKITIVNLGLENYINQVLEIYAGDQNGN